MSTRKLGAAMVKRYNDRIAASPNATTHLITVTIGEEGHKRVILVPVLTLTPSTAVTAITNALAMTFDGCEIWGEK